VLHFHGGAYIANSPDNYREYGYRLSQAANARVLLGSYRHAPEQIGRFIKDRTRP
jgi:acetyl esterase/lipase